jgi:hypothetical protein
MLALLYRFAIAGERQKQTNDTERKGRVKSRDGAAVSGDFRSGGAVSVVLYTGAPAALVACIRLEKE